MEVVKTYKHIKEPDIYYYFNTKNEKLWMYRHRYYDHSGKRREKRESGFKTDKEALKALLKVKAISMRGETKQFDYEKMTVGQWLDSWYKMNCNKWKESTSIQREHIIRLHLKPLLGNHKLHKLDKVMYKRDFLNVVEGKFSPATIRLWHKVFNIAINAAVEDEILPRNRFHRMPLPKDNENMSNYLSPEELKLFLEDIKNNDNITNYTIVLTLVFTGMRKGELMGLQWKNINFKNNTIRIERTRDDKSARSPKTKNSYRTIIVDNELMNQLETYMKWCKEVLFSWGKKMKDDAFVFILESGDPIYERLPNNILQNSFKRIKISEITVHGLRHTHATILLNEGQDVKVIAERLGNTPDMIHKVYGHITEKLEVKSVAAFSESLKSVGVKFGVN
ncbi:tyrosine-type recombinase/integrase [Ureibacillus composti]